MDNEEQNINTIMKTKDGKHIWELQNNPWMIVGKRIVQTEGYSFDDQFVFGYIPCGNGCCSDYYALYIGDSFSTREAAAQWRLQNQ